MAAPSRRIDIDPNDADFAAYSAEHPDDASVVSFRVGTLRELQRMSAELEHMTEEVEQLNALLTKYRSPIYAHRDVIIVEIFLSLASLWASFVLFTSPDLFETFPTFYRYIHSLEGNEAAWGLFALASALMKIVGVATCFTGERSWARIARYAGLAMSGLFWSLMGGGVLLGNPHTLFGFNSLLMGLFSFWSLLRLLK